MCSLALEYQLINPTTQVALRSICIGNCGSLIGITWKIYYGAMDPSNTTVEWTPLNSTNTSLESQFFGKILQQHGFQFFL